MAVLLQQRRHVRERLSKKDAGPFVGHYGAHFPRQLAEVACEKFFVFPVDTCRRKKSLSVKIGADAHLNSVDVRHEHKAHPLGLALPEFRCENRNDVATVAHPSPRNCRTRQTRLR
jgi:hypothetical protein